MDKYLQLAILVLGLVEKIFGAFKKTPSQKIKAKKTDLRKKLDKFRKQKKRK